MKKSKDASWSVVVRGGRMCRIMGAEKRFARWTDKDRLRVPTREVRMKSVESKAADFG